MTVVFGIIQMVIALLAVHKAGGAYVPLDPLFPIERLSTIAEDARLHVLITQSGLGGTVRAEGATVVALDRDLPMVAEFDERVVGCRIEGDSR